MPNRTVAGVVLPAVGRWVVDPEASRVEFWVRHLGLAKVRGRFTDLAGVLEIADDPEASRVDVEIAAASIDTHIAARDAHLRSPDFLDVERHPRLTFSSRSVVRTGSRGTVVGDLAIRGVVRPVALDVEFLGAHTDAHERDRTTFTASTTIDRDAFGITGNGALEAVGAVVGRIVTISISVEAIRT